MRPPSLGPNTTQICFPCASRAALCVEAVDGTWGWWETLLFSSSIPDLPQARDFMMRRAAKPLPLGALGTGEWKTCPRDTVRRHKKDQAWDPTRFTQLWKPALGAPGCQRGIQGYPGRGVGWGPGKEDHFSGMNKKEGENSTCFLLCCFFFASWSSFSQMLGVQEPTEEKGLLFCFCFMRARDGWKIERSIKEKLSHLYSCCLKGAPFATPAFRAFFYPLFIHWEYLSIVSFIFSR